jgi:DNA-binding transcriptional MocR family regulator
MDSTSRIFSDEQQRALDAIQAAGPAGITNRALAAKLGLTLEQVASRTGRLRKRGIIKSRAGYKTALQFSQDVTTEQMDAAWAALIAPFVERKDARLAHRKPSEAREQRRSNAMARQIFGDGSYSPGAPKPAPAPVVIDPAMVQKTPAKLRWNEQLHRDGLQEPGELASLPLGTYAVPAKTCAARATA